MTTGQSGVLKLNSLVMSFLQLMERYVYFGLKEKT